MTNMEKELIDSCPRLIEYIEEVGFLPLLPMGIAGWSAEEVTDEDCHYTQLPDGGWEWPLWEWKGSILQESGCAYGKFFNGKAAFISRAWWPDFCNYRRSIFPYPEEGSIEETILFTLKHNGSLITRNCVRPAASRGQRCGAVSTRTSPGWKWAAMWLRKTLSIRATATDGNMAGAGHCLPRPKLFSDAKPVIPTVLRRNRVNGYSASSGKSCRTNQRKYLRLY